MTSETSDTPLKRYWIKITLISVHNQIAYILYKHVRGRQMQYDKWNVHAPQTLNTDVWCGGKPIIHKTWSLNRGECECTTYSGLLRLRAEFQSVTADWGVYSSTTRPTSLTNLLMAKPILTVTCMLWKPLAMKLHFNLDYYCSVQLLILWRWKMDY